MGSIGPQLISISPQHYLFLMLLFPIFEFRLLRSCAISMAFLLNIIIGINAQEALWNTLLKAAPANNELLLAALANFLVLLVLTWLLWQRTSGFWRSIASIGWLSFAVTAGYFMLKVLLGLQGFFHWVQAVEFLLISLLLNLPPWIVFLVLKRRDSRRTFGGQNWSLRGAL